MHNVTAKAGVPGIRQETQFTCVAASLCGALRAWGKNVTEDDVNRVLGCQPLRGASWEEALATAQYFGMRGTLVVPATLSMLRNWTDQGVPVMIVWNPENRPWSHASVVYDVDDKNVYVMDPNLPDPARTTRATPHEEFYRLWMEKINDSLIVRRPAMAVEREISSEGRQLVASFDGRRVAARHGSEAREAVQDYVQAVTNLESSTDLVMLATNKLRSLGLEPRDDEYPFAESIEHVASDIFRWRGEVDAKYAAPDLARVASRVARKHAERK